MAPLLKVHALAGAGVIEFRRCAGSHWRGSGSSLALKRGSAS